MCPIFVIKFSGVSDLQGVKVPVFPLTLLVIVTTVLRYRAACDCALFLVVFSLTVPSELSFLLNDVLLCCCPWQIKIHSFIILQSYCTNKNGAIFICLTVYYHVYPQSVSKDTTLRYILYIYRLMCNLWFLMWLYDASRIYLYHIKWIKQVTILQLIPEYFTLKTEKPSVVVRWPINFCFKKTWPTWTRMNSHTLRTLRILVKLCHVNPRTSKSNKNSSYRIQIFWR